MKKLRSYLAAASVRLGLPMDIAAGLPHLEVNGFRECSVDRHTGILEYNRERIVIGLNIGSLTVVGSGLEIRQMHRERLTIIGQIEGHQAQPETIKTTKYEHLLPMLASLDCTKQVDGVLFVVNTIGGDVSCGLALSEMIASLSKPSVALVVGDSHSIGVPLAVSTDYSFIVPSGTMVIHPVRMNGTVIGAQPTYDYFKQMQDRILKFIAQHSKAEQKRLEELMMNTGILTKDLGTILVGRQAVEEGLIDSIGGIHEAFAKLHQLIQETKSGGKKSF